MLSIKKTIFTLMLAMAVAPLSAQKIMITQSIVDCGISAYERPVTATFSLENKENTPLTIEKVRVSCGCLEADYPKSPIPSGGKFTLKVTYDGRQLGRYIKSVGIYTTGSDKPTYLTMTGVVRSDVADFAGTYPYKIGHLRVDKRDVEFDDVNRGDNPTAEIFVVNEGTESLTPNLMHMPPYLTAIATPETLRPGKSGKIVMTLNSERLRDYGLTQTSVYLANNLGDKTSSDNEINVSAILLHDFDKLTATTKVYSPKLHLSAKELNLDLNGKKKKSGKITITNNGRTDLDISSLQMFTRGMTVTLSKSKLAPGQKATLKITVMGDDIKKVRTKPRVLMITNDPDNSKVVINVNVK